MLGVLVLLLTGAVQYERIDPDLWRSDPVDQEEETYGFELKDLTLEMVFDLILCNGKRPAANGKQRLKHERRMNGTIFNDAHMPMSLLSCNACTSKGYSLSFRTWGTL